MDTRCGELVAANEPTVIAKPLPDAIMVEDNQRNGCLSNPARANESDWSEGFREIDDRLDQFVASKTDPWRRRRRFSRRDAMQM